MSVLLIAMSAALAGVEPLLETAWGQDEVWGAYTPLDADGEPTAAGCTTVAAAQVLYYYRYQNTASSDVSYGLDNDVTGADIEDRWLYLDLPTFEYDWDAMATSDSESTARTDAAAEFIYHVAATLNAQFGDASGSPASGKQLENAFRYQWGYNSIPRREMSVISKSAFGYSDAEWADLIRAELDAGRPVIYMAQEAEEDAGHAFVIDGYKDDGTVHVNWGWGGYADRYVDPSEMTDHRGRKWNRDAMIFLGLEPAEGYAAAMRPPGDASGYTWTGTGSIISNASGNATGYGLTQDEARVTYGSGADPIVFFQWEVDATDGTKLVIDASTSETATITYGDWARRSMDRVYRDVSLPFVLDPSRDGFSASNKYFVVAVALSEEALSAEEKRAGEIVYAQATTESASSARSSAASAITVDGHTWNGNGSIISYASGHATGYGLTQDEARIHPGNDPVVFFQWEIDATDGTKLVIDADGREATIQYGTWSADRQDDVRRTVTLPYTIDPAADGLSSASGEYYVISVAFPEAPAATTTVTAVVEK